MRFKVVVFGCLFLYVFLIAAVLLADVQWLTKTDPLTGARPGAEIFAQEEDRSGLLFSLKLSLSTSLTTAVLAMAMAIPGAYALSRYRFPGRQFVDTIIDLPIVVPPLMAGISLLIFFKKTWLGGVLDSSLGVVYTPVGIVVAQFFVASAFSMRALKVVYDQINPRFEFVARTLGCGPFQAFMRVALPLAKRGMIAGLIMTWARAMGEFAPVMILAGATPGKTDVLSVSTFLNLSHGQVPVAVALTVLMVVISATMLMIFKRIGGKGFVW